jgi:hypothetical protein
MKRRAPQPKRRRRQVTRRAPQPKR